MTAFAHRKRSQILLLHRDFLRIVAAAARAQRDVFFEQQIANALARDAIIKNFVGNLIERHLAIDVHMNDPIDAFAIIDLLVYSEFVQR